MAMTVTWVDNKAGRHAVWEHLLRRLAVLLRQRARRRAQRRIIRSILAETADPRMLADVGIDLVQPRHLEHWAEAMLCHHQ